ncbi:slipin family protein [Sporobolomyces koalae]|uniref:slipin family protein n=1 Tax=Sporobolomyces koalae TaxID=500713 RepID=UPI0031734121
MSTPLYEQNGHSESVQRKDKQPSFDHDDLDEPRSGAHAITTQPKATNERIMNVQPLRKADMQPSYAQEIAGSDVDHGCYGSMINCLGSFAGTLGSIPCCICCPNPYKQVKQGSVGLVSTFGQFSRSVDPGLVKINPWSEDLRQISVKIQVVDIPRQTVLSRDGLNCQIESVLIFQINNPYKACFAITDVRAALVERAQTTLRDVCGNRNLQNLLTEREAVASEIEQIVEQSAESWGVRCEAILIKDIVVPQEVQNALSAGAQARRTGEAKIITARAESLTSDSLLGVSTARLFREAADLLSSPAAIQIRQLETLQSMAKNPGTKVLFVPMSLGAGGEGVVQNAMNQQALSGVLDASGSGVPH